MSGRAKHRFQPYGEVLAGTDEHAKRWTVLSRGDLASSCWNFRRTVGSTSGDTRMNLHIIIGRNGAGFTSAESQPMPSCRRRESRRRHWSAQSWWPLVLLALCLAGVPRETAAQAKGPPVSATANRYLFIVETSRVTKSRGDGVLNAVQDLLNSGIRGQLQRGDTIGVWTYNSELYQGQLPLQEWSREAQAGVTGRVLSFLRNQKCENKPRLEKVMPAMQQVVGGSRYITVILISSGQEELSGTPFDAGINQLYKTWRTQQEKAHMPFVTVLRGQNGSLAEYHVSQAPWPAEVPALPKELLAARAKPKPVAVPVAKAAPAVIPPLIVTGRKPQPNPPPALAPAPAPAHGFAGAGYVVTNSAPESAAVPTPPPTSPATQTNVASPLPVATATSVSTPAVVEAHPGELAMASRAPGELPVAPPPVVVAAAPAVVSPPPGAPASAPAAVPPPAQAHQSETVQAKPAAAASPAPVAATISPEHTFFDNKLVWLGALCGAGLVFGSAWFWRARSRHVEPVSLITHSLEQHKP